FRDEALRVWARASNSDRQAEQADEGAANEGPKKRQDRVFCSALVTSGAVRPGGSSRVRQNACGLGLPPLSGERGYGEPHDLRREKVYWMNSSASSPALMVISPASSRRRMTSTICCCTCS